MVKKRSSLGRSGPFDQRTGPIGRIADVVEHRLRRRAANSRQKLKESKPRDTIPRVLHKAQQSRRSFYMRGIKEFEAAELHLARGCCGGRARRAPMAWNVPAQVRPPERT